MDREEKLIYDAFITYRGGPDSEAANRLYELLSRYELRPAIDTIDFSATSTFLAEMARCVMNSRFTIALVSSRYATGRFVQEEAIMQRILDGRENKQRLIVAYIENCDAPLWMQSLVGIKLFRDEADGNFNEHKRLIKLLKTRGLTKSPTESKRIDEEIERRWKDIPAKILKYGTFGLAAYGAAAAAAAMDLDTPSGKADSSTIGDSVADGVSAHADGSGEHIVDHVDGIFSGVGEVLGGAAEVAGDVLTGIGDAVSDLIDGLF